MQGSDQNHATVMSARPGPSVPAKLRVAVAVHGTFHAPHLAFQLHQRNALSRVVTANPKLLLRAAGCPRTNIRLLIAPALASDFAPTPARAIARKLCPGDPRDVFDRFAARAIPEDVDLVVAWSGSARRTLGAARARDQLAVVERGSTHILTQRALLAEEYDRLGMTSGPLPDDRTIESELAEYELAHRIVIPSAFVERSFLAHGIPPERLIVNPYGVDSDFFRPLAPIPPTFTVAHVGAISARKGVHYLLQAFSELKLPNAELRLFGPVSPEIAPLLEHYPGNLTHVGPVPKRELPARLSGCSLLVLASIEEGLAMVQAEAMACGRPVICTENTGGSDLMEDGVHGYVVRPRDVDGLKQRILSLYDDHETLLRMGGAARTRAEELSWDAYGNRMWTAYQQLPARTRIR